MNPQFQTIGQAFTSSYYSIFDNKATRSNIVNFYAPDALLTFEGEQMQGIDQIRIKLTEKFAMNMIQRQITKVDCQPMDNGGILVFSLGQLADSEGDGKNVDKPIGYTQVFVLKPMADSFFIAHEIFRLALHDFGV